LLAALAATLAGCPSTSLYRTADPVPEGEWRIGGALDLGVMSDREQKTRIPTLDVELLARRGVSENLDIGGKLHFSGAQVNATWRVHRENGWSYAIAPSLGGMRAVESPATVDSINLFAGLSAIASNPLSKRWTMAAGPISGWGLYWPETGGSAHGAWLGAFVHFEAKVGSKWRISPELSAYRVFAGEVPVRGASLQLGASFVRDL
jgi:hypothetical protein